MAQQYDERVEESGQGKDAENLSGSRKNIPIGTYNGEDLRPFEGRPGAMDAYKIPSLIAGKRVYRGEQ